MARLHIPFTGPESSDLTRAECEEAAHLILEKFDAEWIEGIVRNMGGRISTPDLETHQIDLEVFGPGDFEIFESGLAAPARRDFTTATMIGHYVLHFPAILKLMPGVGMQVPRDRQHPPSSRKTGQHRNHLVCS